MSFSNFPSFKFRDRSNDNTARFVNDLRKELDNDRKMFDDDFGFFSTGRPSNLRSRLGQHNPGSFFTRNFESPPSASAFSSSSHPGTSSSSSESSNSSSGERVIPIRVCTDDQPSSSTKSQTNNGSTSSRGASPKPDSQKAYSTQRNNTTEMPRVKEISRGQRAQSAPPGPDPTLTECGGGQSKKSNTNVRHIPIFVEGGQNSSSSQQHKQQQQKPKGPTDLGGGDQDPNRSSDPELKPTPPKKPTLLDPLEKIRIVSEQVKELAEKVVLFTGKDGKDKEYLYLDEMLTRLLIQLDDVVVEGRDDIRQARRECIKAIQKCISDLDIKIQTEAAAAAANNSLVEPVTTTNTKTENSGVGDKTKDENSTTTVAVEPTSVPPTCTTTEQEKLQNENKNQDGGVHMVVDDGNSSSANTNPSSNPSTVPPVGAISSSFDKMETSKPAAEQVKEKSLPPESDKMETNS